MSRRSRAGQHVAGGDARFESPVALKFINNLMMGGKKSTAEKIFYEAMDVIEEKSGQSGLQVFNQAIQNAKPSLEVKSRRVGGATYQVPIEVRPERRTAVAIKWLIGFSRNRPERSMAERLAAELMAAGRNEGSTIKKKDDVHRMAEANKAFAHYRW
jgi:small subunit ribosomal protein S7